MLLTCREQQADYLLLPGTCFSMSLPPSEKMRGNVMECVV